MCENEIMTSSIRNQLACSLGRRDEKPNVALAESIVATENASAVAELISLLKEGKSDVPSDCIKVLYEIGYRKPQLIVSYVDVFLQLLSHKQNRMQWGAMTALSSIASLAKPTLYKAIPLLLDVAEKGSVITRDHLVKILAAIAQDKKYRHEMFILLNEQLQNCPVNQLPSYAEQTAAIAPAETKAILLHTISLRLRTIDIATKRKRLEKLIRSLH